MVLTHKRTIQIIAAVATVGLLAVGQQYSYGKKSESSKAEKLPPLVTVIRSQSIDLPVKFSAQGHLVALNQVDIRPQVTAVIRSVHFHEGDQIKAGQLLFSLEATDANAQLRRAQAQSAQIQAQLDDARRELERSRELLKEEFISPSAFDTAGSKVETLHAQLRASHADIESARVLLDHTRIFSPISGQAGALTVHPGSLAQQSAAAPLVTLAQLDPIGVDFSLPEQDLTQLLTARTQGPIQVTLDLPGGAGVEGVLSFINNTVSTDTGTINVKASFPNPGKKLWPGAFTRLTVSAGVDKAAIVLPPQAILEGPGGRFVYLLGVDDKVTPKPVTLLRLQDRQAVITGLASGEIIVLEGNQNLRGGTVVRSKDAPPVVTTAEAKP